jgi:LysR family glycine cleavage system transcriptional activator
MASEKLSSGGWGDPARRLPPLNALRAFEAAARHENLARAAEELGVTPGAVSQQIRQLEELLGVALFRRQSRGVVLTADAAAVLPLVSDAFERLREAGEALAGGGDQALVRVGAPGAFAARWLAPRVGAFEREHDRYSVTVIAEGGSAAALQRGQLDLEIRFGDGDYPGWESRRLLAETVSPAVSPELLAASGLTAEQAVAKLPLAPTPRAATATGRLARWWTRSSQAEGSGSCAARSPSAKSPRAA